MCGGATGIGAATARLLASRGAAVCMQYHTRESQARELCAQLRSTGGSVDVAQADLTEPGDIERLVESISAIHGIVHSVSPPLQDKNFQEAEWEEYERHWRTAVQSAYWLVKLSLRIQPDALRSVVFILSTSTIGVPPKRWAPYVSAKYALLGLAKSMAVELAGTGIRVNCVSPGFTSTPLTAHVEPRLQDFVARSIPAGRLSTVEDVAAAVAFLLSDESSFVTGVNLPVSGGAAM